MCGIVLYSLGSLGSIHRGCIHFDVRRPVLNVFLDMLVRSSHCGVGWESDILFIRSDGWEVL